ncbi:hypothetical protein [Chryseobacterium sp. WLY505]|uniref:hypothetical protein n=1 Tax=Chryseobacterium sp. WLY505 TaxID=3068892 RepID=UPI002796D083|nr:hypothetical protein [Chryseobacterium sp. WLY505]MDQ1857715.1 hypothetical protein [Chryseobacterium sp. WLY505]
MKKNVLLLGSILISLQTFSQVGINTTTPQASLDVTGKPTSTNVLDGIIAPRISGTQLRAKTYTASQTGAMVYVTAADTAPAGQTVDIKSSGYYYFDGSLNKWQKLNAGNITAGDLTPDAFIDDPANTMVKLGNTSSGTGRVANTDFVIKDDGTVGIGTSSPDSGLHIKENSTTGSHQIKVESVSNAPLIALERTGSNNLSAGTELGKVSFNGKISGADFSLAGIKANYWGNGTTNSSSLTFSTSDRPAAVINENGNMGIGRSDINYAMSPTQKLDVDGNVRFRGVPDETGVTSTERIIVLKSDGTAKKVPLESMYPPDKFSLDDILVNKAGGSVHYDFDYPTTSYSNIDLASFSRTITIPPNTIGRVSLNYSIPAGTHTANCPNPDRVSYIGVTFYKNDVEQQEGSRKVSIRGLTSGARMGTINGNFSEDITNNTSSDMTVTYRLAGYAEGFGTGTCMLVYNMWDGGTQPNYNWGRGTMTVQMFKKPL